MKKLLLALLGTILLVVGYSAFIWLQKEKTLDERRHYIFCEQLKTGMNKLEVLTVLRKYGDFEYGWSDFGEGFFRIYGNYKDPSIIGKGTIELVFVNHKLHGTFTLDFDRGVPICTQ